MKCVIFHNVEIFYIHVSIVWVIFCFVFTSDTQEDKMTSISFHCDRYCANASSVIIPIVVCKHVYYSNQSWQNWKYVFFLVQYGAWNKWWWKIIYSLHICSQNYSYLHNSLINLYLSLFSIVRTVIYILQFSVGSISVFQNCMWQVYFCDEHSRTLLIQMTRFERRVEIMKVCTISRDL